MRNSDMMRMLEVSPDRIYPKAWGTGFAEWDMGCCAVQQKAAKQVNDYILAKPCEFHNDAFEHQFSPKDVINEAFSLVYSHLQIDPDYQKL
ncbi:hypothetical protein N0V85_007145 [Neurospora sp. IMI 360204]|nr:hypothetical protein N0V85_007145 [Neurospora sp. IMI 360204]